jgi:hypothetical protein
MPFFFFTKLCVSRNCIHSIPMSKRKLNVDGNVDGFTKQICVVGALPRDVALIVQTYAEYTTCIMIRRPEHADYYDGPTRLKLHRNKTTGALTAIGAYALDTDAYANSYLRLNDPATASLICTVCDFTCTPPSECTVTDFTGTPPTETIDRDVNTDTIDFRRIHQQLCSVRIASQQSTPWSSVTVSAPVSAPVTSTTAALRVHFAHVHVCACSRCSYPWPWTSFRTEGPCNPHETLGDFFSTLYGSETLDTNATPPIPYIAKFSKKEIGFSLRENMYIVHTPVSWLNDKAVEFASSPCARRFIRDVSRPRPPWQPFSNDDAFIVMTYME